MRSLVLALALGATTLAATACGDKDDDDTGGGAADDSAADDTGATGDACQPVEWSDGSTGTMTVSGGEDDRKHHWNMPEGIVRIVGTATWEATDWTMELGMGTGTCPDSGQQHCAEEATGGTVTATLLASDLDVDSFDDGDRWFAHLAMRDGAGVGDSTGYSIDVQACTTVE